MVKISSIIVLSALFVCTIIALPTSFEDAYEDELINEIDRSARNAKWSAVGKLTGKLLANAVTYIAVAYTAVGSQRNSKAVR